MGLNWYAEFGWFELMGVDLVLGFLFLQVKATGWIEVCDFGSEVVVLAW